MTTPIDLAELHDVALAAGAVGVGVTTAAPFEDVRDELERRSESGERGDLDFTYKDPAAATDITSRPVTRRLCSERSASISPGV